MQQKVAEYDYPEEVLYKTSGTEALMPEFIPTILDNDTLQINEGIKKKAQVQLQTKYGISITAIFGFAAIISLIVAILLANVNYVALADSVMSLQSDIEELSAEEKKLQLKYEEAFDINEIEQYATDNLNMSKPAEDQKTQMRYIQRDKGEILENDEA